MRKTPIAWDAITVQREQELKAHEEQRQRLIVTELIVLALEWYEILVAVDEVTRLEFINKLGEEAYGEPIEPGDRNYPEPTITHRSYKQQDVTKIVTVQLRKMDAFLKEEDEAIKRAGKETRRSAIAEEQSFVSLNNNFVEVHGEIRKQSQLIMNVETNAYEALMKQYQDDTDCLTLMTTELKNSQEMNKETASNANRRKHQRATPNCRLRGGGDRTTGSIPRQKRERNMRDYGK